MSSPLPDLPNIDAGLFQRPAAEQFAPVGASRHAPRILLLYGSLRPRSFSRLLTFEAQRLLTALGAETRIYYPEGLPLPDGHTENHPKVQELRNLAAWSEGALFRRLPNGRFPSSHVIYPTTGHGRMPPTASNLRPSAAGPSGHSRDDCPVPLGRFRAR